MYTQLRVGTRKSALAMCQTAWVVERLKEFYPGVQFEIVGMKTLADHVLHVALPQIGEQGLFTKELELALINGEIDLAVHSLKDLPSVLAGGLTLAAVCKREYPGDVLVARTRRGLAQLPAGASVGTSSLRRRAQILHYRPDLRVETLRGNVLTRLKRVEDGDMDAAVLAYAGLCRLDLLAGITERIPFDICLPAVGQGALGIEARADDSPVLAMAGKLDHLPSRQAVTGERAFLRILGGGCQVPIGALGQVEVGKLVLSAVVARPDGARLLKDVVEGPPGEAERLGGILADRMLAMGAGDILRGE